MDRTIEYFEFVWRHKLFPEYEQVLHDQFEFFLLERDISDDCRDSLWLPECDRWNRTEELTIAFHMFDPNYSGPVSPADEIEIELTELSRRTLATNHFEVTCSLQGTVLTAAVDEWSFDTRLLIEIVPDPDEPGLFQIIKQAEVDPV